MCASGEKERVKRYYDQSAEGYLEQYKETYKEYPANQIRLKIVLQLLRRRKVKAILDAGCGACGPLVELLRAGFCVKGFDFSEEMVLGGKANLRECGFDDGLISVGDIEERATFPRGHFNATLALGVFPHLTNEGKALQNLHDVLDDDGIVITEFRNDLFDAYTLNKYSYEFFWQLLVDQSNMPEDIQNALDSFLTESFHIANEEVAGDVHRPHGGRLQYTEILAKFHNPLTISGLFEANGFKVEGLYFYHYHALPPVFEKRYPQFFREQSLKMENPQDWRGYLMASAFLVLARKGKNLYMAREST